jgi:hypothetical protein
LLLEGGPQTLIITTPFYVEGDAEQGFSNAEPRDLRCGMPAGKLDKMNKTREGKER